MTADGTERKKASLVDKRNDTNRRELARVERNLRNALLPTPEQRQLVAQALAFCEQLRREDEAAEQQGRQLLKLGDLPWQAAVAHLTANPPDALTILWLIEEVKRVAITDTNSARAKMRNAEPRAEVLRAWECRTDDGQSKESFAREWSARLRKEHGISVTSRTISSRWLKGR